MDQVCGIDETRKCDAPAVALLASVNGPLTALPVCGEHLAGSLDRWLLEFDVVEVSAIWRSRP